MSMRTTGRSRTQQKQQPAVVQEERKSTAASPKKERRRVYDIVVLLVVLALASLLIYSLTSMPTSSPSTSVKLGGKKGTTGSTAYPQSAGGLPVISEIMPANKGALCASDGNYYDWIEIYNPTDKAINLEGFTLSDKVKKPKEYVFPSYLLEPGKFVIVFASSKTAGEATDKTELHALFNLSAAGETVIMSDPNGNEIQKILFPSVGNNYSYACDMTDLNNWAVTDKYTPGFANTNEGYAAYMATRHVSDSPIIINEVMPGNKISNKDADGDYSDWVELYNTSDQAVSLKGWGLSKSETDPKRWMFPDITIEPKKYLVIYLSGKNRTDPAKELHANFGISPFKDMILISNALGLIASEVNINNLKDDTSYGLIPGTDKWQVFTHATPGNANTEDGFNALQPSIYSGADKQPVIISEVMTGNISTLKDDFNEYPSWVEIHNQSQKTVNLKGYGLSDKANEPGRWKFPDMTLDPDEYMVVYASGRNLTDKDAVSKKKLHTDFKLDLTGGVVLLTAPNGSVADRCLLPALHTDMTYGRPQGKIMFQYITQPTPGEANPDGYPGFAPEPIFSLKPGMYEDAQQVSLTTYDQSDSIAYTTDSTVPEKGGASYSQPFDLQKTTVIRAISYRDGYLPSNVVCASYLINEKISLPVISIVTDPKNLFDEQTGIFAKGPNANPKFPFKGANFWQPWERLAHLELLETDGTVGISQDIGIRIFGAYSRGNDQKSLALMANKKYGNGSFDYPIFPDLPYNKYDSFIVRNSAQDANMSRIRDVLQTSLVKDTTDMDLQAYRDCVVYINGNFWGVYHMREKLNEHFFAQHYNVDPLKLDFLVGNGDKNSSIQAGSNEDYLAMRDFIRSHDMADSKNYEYIKTKMDVDEYIDYIAIEMYTGNTDLGNIKFWRPQTTDGKWRWVLYDLDWGFFTVDSDNISKFLDPQGNGVGHMFDNSIALNLLKNPEFKQKLLERMAYHTKVTFAPDRVLSRIDELVASIEPYMARDKAKWKTGTVERWKRVQIGLLKTFAQKRPEFFKSYMKQYFNLTDAQMNDLFK